MKRVLSLTMAGMLLFSTTAFAAELTVDQAAEELGVNVLNKGEDVTKLNAEYTGEEDGEYILWVLDEVVTDPDEASFAQGNVLYINQSTADSNGVAAFNNFLPMKTTDSTVIVTGEGVKTIIGYIEAKGRYLSGVVALQERVDNKGGADLIFTDAAGKEFKVTTDENDWFEITLPEGEYTLTITRSGFLSYTKETFVVASDTEWEVEMEDLELLAGDVDGSGRITAADFGLVVEIMGQKGTDLLEDVDGSGRVTAADFGIIVENMGKKSS